MSNMYSTYYCRKGGPEVTVFIYRLVGYGKHPEVSVRDTQLWNPSERFKTAEQFKAAVESGELIPVEP